MKLDRKTLFLIASILLGRGGYEIVTGDAPVEVHDWTEAE